jgi:rRNA maturation RNase YbeY
MSFDITEPEDPKKLFADIFISTDRAIANARVYKTKPLFELYLYVIHGILHILGYDDKKRTDRLRMQKKEKQILKTLNLSF